MAGRRLRKLSCRHTLPFMKKEGWLREVEPVAEMTESTAMENYSQAWKPSQGPFAQLDFRIAMNQWFLHTLDFLLWWTRIWRHLRPAPLLYTCCFEVRKLDSLVSQFCRWRGTVLEKLYPRSFTHTQIKRRWLLDFEQMLTYIVQRIYFSSCNKSSVWHQ